ncbi:MAG: hypothetical protein ACPGQD_05105 [Planctomycetota bacterium]
MKRLLSTLLVLSATAALAPAQQEAELKSGDVKKLAKPFGEWLDAQLEGKPTEAGEAMADLDEAVEKLKKKLKGRDPLALVADWEVVLQEGRNFATNGKLMSRGKVSTIEFPSGIEADIRKPLKYTPDKTMYPTIVLLGADARAAVEGLDKGVADPFIVVMPDMTDLDEEAVTEVAGFTRIAGPIGQSSLYYGVDRRRLFLVALDDNASAVARRLAAEVPNYFAGMALLGKADGEFKGMGNLKLVPQAEGVSDLAGALAWALEQGAVNPYPSEFEYEIAVPWQGRAYWVQATNFDSATEDGAEPARFKVAVDRDSNTITLDTAAIYRVRIYLSDAILDLDRPITVVRNGEPYTYQPSRSIGTLLSNFGSTLDRSVFPSMISSLDVPLPSEAAADAPTGN